MRSQALLLSTNQLEREGLRWRSVLREEIGGVRPVDELHRDPQPTVLLVAVVLGDDVRMRQAREQVRFPCES
ncbi:hypothetical protein GCM10023197_32680 [Gordonia humi]